MWSSSPSDANAAIVFWARATRRLLLAGVQLERAAAVGRLGREHLEALGGERTDRGLVHVGVEHPLHAAEQQRHAAALRRRPPGCARAASRAVGGRWSAAPPWPGCAIRSGSLSPPSLRPATSSGASARIRLGWGSVSNSSRRRPFSAAERAWWRSTWGRTRSIRRSYWTPDGHAVTHAMQPRQRSKCVTISSDIGASPFRPSSISTIRPRGESASLPHST